METNLYRKYRPHNFGQVVGQQVVVRTLQNSIINKQLAHAYLFSGVRGTGKTSIAKIFAKAVNCLNNDTPQCGECEICQEFASGSEIADIFEIDAASNNGVEEIRRIIDNVKYLPIRLKYKVYIIDEVHMLSKGAFNALLKTLEEPPAHVIFILATTEPNKIPVTILSRVQRFDFSRIDNQLMKNHLQDVLDKEQISYEPQAVDTIVYHAQGGLRDGLSLLTKVIAYKPQVTEQTVSESLNLSTSGVTEELVQAIVDKEPKRVANQFHELVDTGCDVVYLVQDIIRISNQQLLKSISENQNLVSIYTKIINRLLQVLADVKSISNANLYIEVNLIRLAVKEKEAILQAPKASPQVQTISEDQKLDKLQKQADQLATIAKDKTSLPPKDNSASVIEKTKDISSPPKMKDVDLESPRAEIDFEMDLLFANKTGKDVSAYQPQVKIQKEDDDSANEAPKLTEQTNNLSENDNIIANEEQAITTPFEDEESELLANNSEQQVNNEAKVKASMEHANSAEESSENDQITIIDILQKATNQDKQTAKIAAKRASDELSQAKEYGIAKYFEESEIRGASSFGLVVSIDHNYYNSYHTRLAEITNIYSQQLGYQVKVHLVTTQYWNEHRQAFVRAVKANREVDIYEEATKIFGKELVNKVNS